jgi:uncharacterized phage protein (TIGR01671 family)
MKDIRFRAWDGESMNYGGFNIHCSGKIQKECFINNEILNVMQFTGLQDKDGDDIYEGDIVDGVLYKDYSKHVGFILYDYNGYRIKTNTKSLGLDLTEKLTVIGNIHQNPELLEQVK